MGQVVPQPENGSAPPQEPPPFVPKFLQVCPSSLLLAFSFYAKPLERFLGGVTAAFQPGASPGPSS